MERLLIVVASALYLIMFNQTVPHGDALRIVRQIDANDLIWNPNHLIFDPVGYGIYHLFLRWFPSITPLGTFEVISAIATIVSLLIFHMILVRSGAASPLMRGAAVLALFGSATFVSVAVSQYFFMVQMPLLLAALYCYIDWLIKIRSESAQHSLLYAIGVFLALATAVMFNNLLLVIVSGLGVGLVHRSWRPFIWQNTLRVYSAAAAVGLPIFLAGHQLADVDSNLLRWLVSYEGNAGGHLNQVYGAVWTPSGVLMGSAMVVFNLLIGSFVDPAGLGTVLSVIVFGQSFEFIPQWSRIGLSLVAIPAVIGMNIWIAMFVFRQVSAEPVVRFLCLWVLAFVLFNFLWNVGDEIFWFQIVPAIWMLYLLSRQALPAAMGHATRSAAGARLEWWRAVLLSVFGGVLLIVNTVTAVVPGANRSFSANQVRHAAMLRTGDLEIVPGWDRQKWMMLPEGSAKVERIVLVNLAVSAMGSDEQMARLPKIVQSHLDGGHRVVVARLFDVDHDLMPWYSLRDLGWPRDRLQSLFDNFCTRPLSVIDGVVFREVVSCDRGPGDSTHEGQTTGSGR